MTNDLFVDLWPFSQTSLYVIPHSAITKMSDIKMCWKKLLAQSSEAIYAITLFTVTKTYSVCYIMYIRQK